MLISSTSRSTAATTASLTARSPGASWTFRSIGYGHDAKTWKDIISALRLVGYDYVISIEHEDAMMSIDEGLAKGVALLKDVIIREQPGEMFWA